MLARTTGMRRPCQESYRGFKVSGIPKDGDDKAADFWGALNLKHLMQHPFVFVFSDCLLIGLEEHVQEDYEEDQ